jgi:hypothetical protein
MLKVAGREEEGWLNSESIDKFPCEDLRTIDQLWVKYSNGRFGFSVQKRIYQSLGGTREYDEKVWTAFVDKVGWRLNRYMLYYKDLIFSEKDCNPCKSRLYLSLDPPKSPLRRGTLRTLPVPPFLRGARGDLRV